MALSDYRWPDNSPEFRWSFSNRLYWNYWKSDEVLYHQFHDIYLQSLARRHASRILIALRRYKKNHNQWPGSLEEIKGAADAEIFVDPVNGGDFVYKLTDEGFRLYSRGENGIDEEGEWNVEIDPNEPKWPIAPTEDDRLYWPRK